MPPKQTWAYEVDVGTISGEVTAPDEDAAMSAATDDALSHVRERDDMADRRRPASVA